MALLVNWQLQDSDGDEPVLCRGIVRLAWTTAGAELRFARFAVIRALFVAKQGGRPRLLVVLTVYKVVTLSLVC